MCVCVCVCVCVAHAMYVCVCGSGGGGWGVGAMYSLHFCQNNQKQNKTTTTTKTNKQTNNNTRLVKCPRFTSGSVFRCLFYWSPHHELTCVYVLARCVYVCVCVCVCVRGWGMGRGVPGKLLGDGGGSQLKIRSVLNNTHI